MRGYGVIQRIEIIKFYFQKLSFYQTFRSIDLTAPDFFHLGYLKDNV